jgi:hypothetical protein
MSELEFDNSSAVSAALEAAFLAKSITGTLIELARAALAGPAEFTGGDAHRDDDTGG